MVTLAAIAGSLVGGRLAGRVQPEHLRRGFGWFVLVMAAFILVQEIPEPVWSAMPAAARVGLAAGVAAVVLGLGFVGQRLGRQTAAGAAAADTEAREPRTSERQAREPQPR
jgi:uncharacterized membrane protein YfcA